MFTRLRNRVWGRGDKAVAGLLSLLLLAGLFVLADTLLPEECGDGLEAVGEPRQCIGVTAGEHVFADQLKELIDSVKAENARVEEEWENKGGQKVPYVKVALMMPYTADPSSAMDKSLIKHALAGAHLAQLRANEDSNLQFQLLLANNGKELQQWEPVVEQLTGMTDDPSPLVAVMGYPSSTPATLAAADALSKAQIPSIGPVITSQDMSSEYLFKTSASNKHLARALEQYLAEHPGKGKGFLVWDSRETDNYAVNLKAVFEKRFGTEYGLRRRTASYVGTMGENLGIPVRFDPIAQEICINDVDTVFFAGRDHDLPALISELAGTANCADNRPIRIVKVGIGLDPGITDPPITEKMREAGIVTVGAADVHPRWWKKNEGQPPGFSRFHDRYQEHAEDWELGEDALDDGYTIMYHDAFTVAAKAADESYTAANLDADKEFVMPSSHDIYNTIRNMSVPSGDGTDCVNCVRGASGTFGFDAAPETDQWAVCKPVPVIVYPRPGGGPDGKGGDRGGGKAPDGRYRTYQDLFGGQCR